VWVSLTAERAVGVVVSKMLAGVLTSLERIPWCLSLACATDRRFIREKKLGPLNFTFLLSERTQNQMATSDSSIMNMDPYHCIIPN